MMHFPSKTITLLRESGFEVDEKRLRMGNCFEHSFYINEKKITKTCYVHPDNYFCFLNIPKDLFSSFEEKTNVFKQIFLKGSNHFLFIFDSDLNNSIYKIFTHHNNTYMHAMLEILKKDLYARSKELIWKHRYDDYVLLCHMKKQTIQLLHPGLSLKDSISSPEEANLIYKRIQQSEDTAAKIEKDIRTELEKKIREHSFQHPFQSFRIHKEVKPRGSIRNFDFQFYFTGGFSQYTIQNLKQNNVNEIVNEFVENIKIMTTFLQIARKYDSFLFLMTDDYYDNIVTPALVLFKREYLLSIKRKEENGILKRVLYLIDSKSREKIEICFSIQQFEKHIKSLRTKSLFQNNNLKIHFISWQTKEKNKKRISEETFSKWFQIQFEDCLDIPFLNKEKKSEFIHSLTQNSQ